MTCDCTLLFCSFFLAMKKSERILRENQASCLIMALMVQQYERPYSDLLCLLQLKMRAGGMSESSKWKKQKRSPRPPRHLVRSPSGQMDPAQSSTLSNNNLSGDNNTLTFLSDKCIRNLWWTLDIAVICFFVFFDETVTSCYTIV